MQYMKAWHHSPLKKVLKMKFNFIIQILDLIHDLLCPIFKDEIYQEDEKKKKKKIKKNKEE